MPRMRSFSRIRGDEPTIVIVPPKIAQNPIGIKRRDIGTEVRTATRLTTGRNRAAAPTFCMKDEMTPTVVEISAIRRDSVLPPTFVIQAATRGHDARSVEARADDHHRDYRDDGVRSEAIEKVSDIDEVVEAGQGR